MKSLRDSSVDDVVSVRNVEKIPQPTSCSNRPSLLVFSDDWGRHPSSCQHLIARLLPKYDVTWVNTIGMRPPTCDLSTVRRMAEKCRHWLTLNRSTNAQTKQPQPTILNPKMWPWFKRRPDRWLNRRLLCNQLSRALRNMEVPTIAITTIPIVADIMDSFPIVGWVYYCVDDFSQWPGLDRHAMATMESKVVKRVDCCIAASQVLQERLSGLTSDVHLLTHGVDLEHWRRPQSVPVSVDRTTSEIEVIFWGLVDRRLDTSFVTATAAKINGRVALIGPEDNPDPVLSKTPRVARIPAMPYDALPEAAAAADVLVMPYIDAPVTRAMQPLKLLEYLATGKPVVARDLPANRSWGDCMDLATSPQEFAELVLRRAQTGLPDEQRLARSRLALECWDSKAQQFEQLLLKQIESTCDAGGS